MERLYSSKVSMRNDKKAKRKVCVEGFELRAIEGRTIISFYLLRIVNDNRVESTWWINLFEFLLILTVAHIKYEYVPFITKPYFCLPNQKTWGISICHNALDLILQELSLFVKLCGNNGCTRRACCYSLELRKGLWVKLAWSTCMFMCVQIEYVCSKEIPTT